MMFWLSLVCALCFTVSAVKARCSTEGPGNCTFQRQHYCDWHNNDSRWNIRFSNNKYAYLRTNRKNGYLRSREACKTNSTHCLKFKFNLESNTTLTVSLKRGKTKFNALWRYRGTSNGWEDGAVPIMSNESYRVKISGWRKKTGTNYNIHVDNITFSHSNCTLEPPSAAVPVTTTTTTISSTTIVTQPPPTTTTTTTAKSTTTPTTTSPSTTTTTATGPTSPASSTPGSSSSNIITTTPGSAATSLSSADRGAFLAEADSSLDAGAVAGLVLAALLVAAASVVLGLFCFLSPRRRRRLLFVKRCCAAGDKETTTSPSFHNGAYSHHHDADDRIVPGGAADVIIKPDASDVTSTYVNVPNDPGVRESSAGEYSEIGDISKALSLTATSPSSPSALQPVTPVTPSTQNDCKGAQPPRKAPEDVDYTNVASAGTASVGGSAKEEENSVYSLAGPVGVKDSDRPLGDDRSGGDQRTYEVVETDEETGPAGGQETGIRFRQNGGRGQALEEPGNRAGSLDGEQQRNGEADNPYYVLEETSPGLSPDPTGGVPDNADSGGIYHTLEATPAAELDDQQQPATSMYHVPRNEVHQTPSGLQHPSQGLGEQRSHKDGTDGEDSVYNHLGDAIPEVCGEAGLRDNAWAEGPHSDDDCDGVYNHLDDGGEDLYSEVDHKQKRIIVIDGDYSHLH